MMEYLSHFHMPGKSRRGVGMGGMGCAQPGSTNLRYHCGPNQASGSFCFIGHLYLSNVWIGEI